jgi:hypothetical protein
MYARFCDAFEDSPPCTLEVLMVKALRAFRQVSGLCIDELLMCGDFACGFGSSNMPWWQAELNLDPPT